MLDEVEPQSLLGRSEIRVGVQRAQDLVHRDEFIEASDDPAERRLTADCLVEALRL